jgi:hypothetical protein
MKICWHHLYFSGKDCPGNVPFCDVCHLNDAGQLHFYYRNCTCGGIDSEDQPLPTSSSHLLFDQKVEGTKLINGIVPSNVIPHKIVNNTQDRQTKNSKKEFDTTILNEIKENNNRLNFTYEKDKSNQKISWNSISDEEFMELARISKSDAVKIIKVIKVLRAKKHVMRKYEAVLSEIKDIELRERKVEELVEIHLNRKTYQ